MHPIYARTFTAENALKLEAYLNNPLVKAVGEIGLDYAYLHETSKKFSRKFFKNAVCRGQIPKARCFTLLSKTNDDGDFSAYEDMANIFKQKPA